MAAILNFTSISSLVFAILILSSLCLIDAQVTGFSVELIHRDSPKSPFYNPSETTSDRVTNAVRRSFARARRFSQTSVTTQGTEYSNVTLGSGDYLMNISIGTPAFDIVAVVDTGSNAIWTQCKPCSHCFEQKAPIFDPSQSSTFDTIACNASQCNDFVGHTYCTSNKTCQYLISYNDYPTSRDHSYSTGDLALDTITFASTTGPPVSFPNMVIGCGHNNSERGYNVSQESGVIGLGRGESSLISQMGSSIEGKYSYCLMGDNQDGSSKMNFGSNANVTGFWAVTTPLIKPKSDTNTYYLNLEAISVGDKRINHTIPPIDGPGTKGNIIIDSGSLLTLVPPDVYDEIESAIASHVVYPKLRGPEGFGLCYDARTGLGVPDITMHFTGADVKLSTWNTFVLAAEKPDPLECLAFASSTDVSIYGNFAQNSFWVGYDLEKETVTFKLADCTL